MQRSEQICEMLAATLGIGRERVSAGTRQADLPEWDSVAHLNLMLALEDGFGVRIEIEDMARLTSVAALVAHVETTCPSN